MISRQTWWRWAPWVSIVSCALMIAIVRSLMSYPFPGAALFSLALLGFGLCVVPPVTTFVALFDDPPIKRGLADATIAAIAVGGMLLLAVFVFVAGVPAPAAAPKAVWNEPVPDSAGNMRLLARAIVAAGDPCPTMKIGDDELAMQARPPVATDRFPVTVCERIYPRPATASVAGVALPVLASAPTRILVIGDTGCRVTIRQVQACGKIDAWPFRAVAAAASALKPDLIIHVGDYHYREAGCPDPALCGDSPFGDTWRAWSADFFEPAGALLTTAPWVMMRGNHEDCARAGTGWFVLLATAVMPVPGCAADGEAYALRFSNLVLAVLDTSDAGSPYGQSARAKRYQSNFEPFLDRAAAMAANQKSHLWLMLHQPLWFFAEDIDATLDDTGSPLSELRGLAVAKKVDLVLSGDTHNFQSFHPDEVRPAQLVAGMSGTALDSAGDADLSRIAGASVPERTLYGRQGKLWALSRFGFVMLTWQSDHWQAAFHDVGGAEAVRCQLPSPGSAAGSCTVAPFPAPP